MRPVTKLVLYGMKNLHFFKKTSRFFRAQNIGLGASEAPQNTAPGFLNTPRVVPSPRAVGDDVGTCPATLASLTAIHGLSGRLEQASTSSTPDLDFEGNPLGKQAFLMIF